MERKHNPTSTWSSSPGYREGKYLEIFGSMVGHSVSNGSLPPPPPLSKREAELTSLFHISSVESRCLGRGDRGGRLQPTSRRPRWQSDEACSKCLKRRQNCGRPRPGAGYSAACKKERLPFLQSSAYVGNGNILIFHPGTGRILMSLMRYRCKIRGKNVYA